MNLRTELFITALAPIIWGCTYYVTTEFLPAGYPITSAFLRAFPAGVLLLIWVRRLPPPQLWLKLLVLGALNFSIFWWLLFESAYRLPGGVAATVGAIQPLIVLALARIWLGNVIQLVSILGGLLGVIGIGLLLLTPQAQFDNLGIMAGIGGAISMAAGTVLSRKWQPNVSSLTFTAWQLIAGGFLLLPFAIWIEPDLPTLSLQNTIGFVFLGFFGAAMSYGLWFRGIARLAPTAISTLGFLSPVTAVIIGWLALNQPLTSVQTVALTLVLFSIWLSQQTHLSFHFFKPPVKH